MSGYLWWGLALWLFLLAVAVVLDRRSYSRAQPLRDALKAAEKAIENELASFTPGTREYERAREELGLKK
jgi:ABC-type transport system involved in cytochrome bd biosynthesis fused ATPase/permease subunit